MIYFTYYTESDQRCIASRRKLVGLRVQYSAALRPSGVKLEVLDDKTPGVVLHLTSILSENYLQRWLILEEVASGLLATVETWQTETGENPLVLTSIFMTQSRFHPLWQLTFQSNYHFRVSLCLQPS